MPPKKKNNASNKQTGKPSTKQTPSLEFKDIVSIPSPNASESVPASRTESNETSDLLSLLNKDKSLLFEITDIPGDLSGRRAIAKHPIPEGVTIICEQSPLWVVHSYLGNEYCHTCSKPLSLESQTSYTDPSQTWHFCSQTCLDMKSSLIEIEQEVSHYYDTIASELEFDEDLLRLATRYILLKYLHHQTSVDDQPPLFNSIAASTATVTAAADATEQGDITHNPYLQSTAHLTRNVPIVQCSILGVDNMAMHSAHITDEGINQTARNAADALSRVIPSHILSALYTPTTTPSSSSSSSLATTIHEGLTADIIQVTGRINANIHGLQTYLIDTTAAELDAKTLHGGADGVSSLSPSAQDLTTIQQYGVGLFPICALFNHSCRPNCLFINQGDRLCLRTLRPIESGEELFVNYLSLADNIFTRQNDLMIEKGFFCQCTRCTTTIPSTKWTLSDISLHQSTIFDRFFLNAFRGDILDKLVTASPFPKDSVNYHWIDPDQVPLQDIRNWFTKHIRCDIVNCLDMVSKVKSLVEKGAMALRNEYESLPHITTADVLPSESTLGAGPDDSNNATSSTPNTPEPSAKQKQTSAATKGKKSGKKSLDDLFSDLDVGGNQGTGGKSHNTGGGGYRLVDFLEEYHKVYPSGTYIPLSAAPTPSIESSSSSNENNSDHQQQQITNSDELSEFYTNRLHLYNTKSLLPIPYHSAVAYLLFYTNHVMQDAMTTYTQDGLSLQQRVGPVEHAFSFVSHCFPIGSQYQSILLPMLINLYSRLADHRKKFDHCLLYCQLTILSHPPGFFTLLNPSETLFNAAIRLEAELTKTSTTATRMLLKTYSSQLKEVKKTEYSRITYILSICFGNQHLQAKQMIKKCSQWIQ